LGIDRHVEVFACSGGDPLMIGDEAEAFVDLDPAQERLERPGHATDLRLESTQAAHHLGGLSRGMRQSRDLCLQSLEAGLDR
jgi:hypothetical protein